MCMPYMCVLHVCFTDLELPREYIEKLFDSVAETYEEDIIPVISYQV